MKVKLQDVLDAMNFTNPETEYYYSTKTPNKPLDLHLCIALSYLFVKQ